ncbi:MAG: hypothetical protein JOY82_19905 [Streptosporangiaceae bacterium]|nr:hypothetical protein [Streptosporangiaceae bacterium]
MGPASDVFSLGAVLAYAATGAPPFGTGTAAAVLYRVVTAPPDLTGVPARLRDAVASCLVKSPAGRPSLHGLQSAVFRTAPPAPSSPASFWPAPVAAVIGAPHAVPAHENARSHATLSAGPRGRSTGTPRQPAEAPSAPRYPPYAVARVPGPVAAAVRLMYAGAALTLISNIINLPIIGQIRTAFMAAYPLLPPRDIAAVTRTADGFFVLNGIVCTAAWLWMARANRRGRSWARTIATVFFGLDTIVALFTIARPGIPVVKGFVTMIWLAGLGAVIALWQRQSGAYFQASRHR